MRSPQRRNRRENVEIRDIKGSEPAGERKRKGLRGVRGVDKIWREM